MQHLPRRKQQLPELGPVPLLISRLPRPYPTSQEQFGDLITKELLHIWMEIMSDSERVDFSHSRPVPRALHDKFDALILKQAETMGWRLCLSSGVQWRFSEWDQQPNGPELFERYGKALAKSARRSQRLELPPIDDPDLHLLKKEMVRELRELLHNIRNEVSTAQRSRNTDELIDLFEETVSDKTRSFIRLKTNSKHWIQFFRENSAYLKELFLKKRASPAALFDEWLAWCQGRDPETVRQEISGLGRFARAREHPPKL